MIDWLLKGQGHLVRFSRWIVLGCAMMIVGISRLPRTSVDRVIALVILVVIGTIFAVWLLVILVTILAPGLFDNLRRRRAEASAYEPR